MPKETVRSQHAMFNVEVRWSRDSEYVQVATVMPEPQSSEGPQNLTELVQSWQDDPREHRGLFSDLNRVQINDLIRVLRRARDQAFGRDE